ncbi:hypothetical protein SV7mr_50460 [Stieleria bergensis]|uniref:Uncharacterized protein n=1 Tax=Stieleria bergensis TaxID=2528025 RepID=A0A517T2A1_9BACT|nr:hypothetical protein SV7mr_50460 [Planctomycetes bacterium SV_7m_r]
MKKEGMDSRLQYEVSSASQIHLSFLQDACKTRTSDSNYQRYHCAFTRRRYYESAES